MRGRAGGTLFVFKKYLQSTLFMLGHNPDVMLRYLLVSALLGGIGGLPFEEDLKSILKALAWQFFGKNFDLERELREYILQFTDGKVDPDLILHGLARRGFGIAGALDAMGSFFTGRPGRGLSAPVEENGIKKGFGQNVPFPVFDRSRALSMGMVSPIDFGKLLGPPTDPEKQIADVAQQASGAIFSVGFNIYKALQDSKTTGIKRWERAMPRAMASGSKALRAFTEGRERGAGGTNSAPTIVNYDPRDPEEMMEIIGLSAGYQPLRAQAKWDSIMAKNEVEKFYDFTRKGLSAQFFEATRGGDPQEINKVRQAIMNFNTNLPDYARGMSLTYESLKASMQARTRELNARESGTPVQKSKIGISRAIDQLYPEATVDVRRAPTR
jgi:alkylhydroperoxidase/carboxymuconolactone decarboxylase family protein YurZ